MASIEDGAGTLEEADARAQAAMRARLARGKRSSLEEFTAVNARRNLDDLSTAGRAAMGAYLDPYDREMFKQRVVAERERFGTDEPQAVDVSGDEDENETDNDATSERRGEGADQGDVDEGDEQPKSNLTRAREALKRTGLMTDEMLAKLSREQILRAGRKAERQHRKAAQKFADQSERHAGNTPAPKPGQATSDDQDGTAQSRVPAPSFDFAKLSKRFEAVDSDTKAALELAIGDVVTHFEGRLTKTPEPSQRDAAQVDNEDPWEEAREAVQDRFPDIAEDDEYTEVQQVAKSLIGLPAYRGMKAGERYVAALNAAAQAAGFDAVGGQADPLRSQRRSGRGSQPQTRNTRPPVNEREAGRRAFKHLQAHPGDIAGARRAAGYAT